MPSSSAASKAVVIAAKLHQIQFATYGTQPREEGWLLNREILHLKNGPILPNREKTTLNRRLLTHKVFDWQSVLQAAGQGHFIGIFEFATKGNAS